MPQGAAGPTNPSAPQPGAGGFSDPKAADAARIMEIAGKFLGEPAPPAGGQYEALLAKAAFEQLTSTANLNNAIASAVADAIKGNVKRVVTGALPSFD
jgi:hypothetical protein